MRREFSKRTKLEAYQRSGGRCENCTASLFVGRVHYDHIIPDAMGGEPIVGNCRVLCTACHQQKTSGSDVPAIAKSNRVRGRHLGLKKRTSKWGYGRNDKWRKKIS